MDIAERSRLLRQSPYFRSVPPAYLQDFAANLHERQYRAGDAIFRKGERGEGLCLVLSGRVKTVTVSAEGREQILKVFGPGRTFADIPVFDDDPMPADAFAVEDSSIAIISQTQLFELLRSHPDACIDVLRLFARRLRAYKLMIEDLSLRSVAVRVARLLLDRAGGQQTLLEEEQSSRLDATQDEIAAMVGSVREVVQRALKTLEVAGLIEMTRGHIRIVDVEALQAWTDF